MSDSTSNTGPAPAAGEAELARLQRRLKRETAARLEAEAIAERGLRDLFKRQQEIALLESIAAASNEAVNEEEAMRHALEAVCRFAYWPLGHLLMVEEGDGAQALRPSSVWHDDGEGRYATLRTLTEATAFDHSTGIPGKVWASGVPAWINGAHADGGNYPRVAEAERVGLRSLFAFPVMIGTEVVAVLEFFSMDLQAPDSDLLRLMAQVGIQLGRVVERSRASTRLMHDALHDPLTQLGNRKLFLDRLHQAMQRAQRTPGYQFSVLFVDLDRFKAINDGLGHQAGDQLIMATAQRLTAALRPDRPGRARRWRRQWRRYRGAYGRRRIHHPARQYRQ